MAFLPLSGRMPPVEKGLRPFIKVNYNIVGDCNQDLRPGSFSAGVYRRAATAPLVPPTAPLAPPTVRRTYDEETEVRIGWAYQQATDWHQRHPPGLG
ncbi:MAG: hypothetical protein ACREE2_06300 [Stellaceae bacterium]